MDKRLKELIKLLRRRTCPPHVLAKVRSQIDAERPRKRRSIGLFIGAMSAMATVILGFVLFQRYAENEPPVPTNTVAMQAAAEELHLSLALIGKAIIDTSSQSGVIVLEQAVPRLSRSFESVKKSLSHSFNP